MKTDKRAFVIYNQGKGFRSARSNSNSYKNDFAKAILYTMKHHAVNASCKNDLVIPVDMKLDPEDLFVAVLKS